MLAAADITVAIPSSRRPRKAALVATKLLPGARVYVAEAEAPEYEAAGVPRAVIRTHPGLLGLARIRNYIVRDCPTRVCIMVDDDFEYVMAMPGRRPRTITDPAALGAIILQTATLADDLRVRAFGWATRGRPIYYRDSDPFSFSRRPLGGALGVIGKDVRWDERLVVAVDTDATLQELLSNRIVLTDNRFFWHCGPVGTGAGGLQKLRTAERVALDQALLRKKWGPHIRIEERPADDGRAKARANGQRVRTSTFTNHITTSRKQDGAGKLPGDA